MKKLLIDINSIVPYFVTGKVTGIGRTTFQLVKSLSSISDRLDFEIRLISQNVKGIGVKELKTSFKGTHIYAPNRPFIKKLYKYFPFRELFATYDLLHVPHNFDYVFNPSKTIITLHDALFMRMNENAFDHLTMRREVPFLVQKCKGIITCSESSKSDIVNTLSVDPSKIDVIYWGVDHRIFKEIEDKDYVKGSLLNRFSISRPFFLSVSCNSERKNTHRLVEAYLRLLKNDPNNDLVLVWENPPYFIKEMISKANASSRILFLSNVNDYELMLLYNGATAMIFPSSYEGFGLPVLEAISCGTPVVTCKNSSLPEVGGDAPIYLNEPSAEEILESLVLFENGSLDNEELSHKGLKQAAKFKWEDTALEYLRVYRKYLDIRD